MIVTCVYVEVKQEFIQDFIKECCINHQHSMNEAGNLRFDVLQDASDPTKFMLYEAYQNEEFSSAHKQTVHYLNWRKNVEHMMVKPRIGVKHQIICPTEIEK